MPTPVNPPLQLNANANINVEFDGSISLNTGTDSAPGSEFQFRPDGVMLVNGNPVDFGGSEAAGNGVTRLANGNVNIQTGSDASPGPLFTFTVGGKLLKDGVEFGGAAGADPAWISPILLSAWKHGQPLNQFPVEPVRYRVNGNKLEFSGIADGSSAAAPTPTNIMFRLPTAIRDRVTYQKIMQVAINSFGTGAVKVFPDGTVCFVNSNVTEAGGTKTLNLSGCYCYLDS